jgi:hypothetical protein
MGQRIQVTVIGYGCFEGIWRNPTINAMLLLRLGLDKHPTELHVWGEYHIEYEEGVPVPYVDSICIYVEAEARFTVITAIDYTHAGGQIAANWKPEHTITSKGLRRA